MTRKDETLTRHEAIKKLIGERSVSDQQTLVSLLQQKFGIEANQSVLSRDLRKLGIVKKGTHKDWSYALPEFDVSTELLKLAIVDIVHNEIMIVVHTLPGLAAFAGDCIDKLSEADILGCLAGENVVFVTCSSIKETQRVFEMLCSKLHFKKHG